MAKGLVAVLFFLAFFFTSRSPGTGALMEKPPVFRKSAWADSLLRSMTLEEKIGQLFMIPAYSNRGTVHRDHLEQIIKKYHPGGVIFFQGSPYKQARLTNHLQAVSKTPLLVAMDAEWGLGMRLDSTMDFPRNMTLGAVTADSLIYRMGKEIGRQCRRLGVHINFAPVVDINNNPRNPVIHTRSFGENKKRVARKGYRYMQGLMDEKVFAVAKHFPGHGDTDKDSHKALPVVNHTKKRLDTLELFPFKYLIKKGVKGIMVAHLYIPALETQSGLPSSLSPSIINDLLYDSLDYKGLVFTDALNMRGVTKNYDPGEAEVRALKAGEDVLLFSKDIAKAVKSIKKAVEKGEITEELIEEKAKKLLYLKNWAGLDQYQPVKINSLKSDLNHDHARLLKRVLVENALTLVKNEKDLVPFDKLDQKNFASVALGAHKNNKFQEVLKRYDSVKCFRLSKEAAPDAIDTLIKHIKPFDPVIISLHNMSLYDVKTFGVTREMVEVVSRLAKETELIIVNFGSPYGLKFFTLPEAILQAYEGGKEFQDLAAQALFGGIPVRGKLPVGIKGKYPIGSGEVIQGAIRLKYTIPQEVGMQDEVLKCIDTLALESIEEKATPGCQILVAKDGKVVYSKSFGHHTYEKLRKVRNTDVYDIASITKIAATLLAVMRFHDLGLLGLDRTLGDYLSQVDSAKVGLKLRELLTHQAGLVSWIPFYKYTLTEGGFCDSNYCYEPNSYFAIEVAKNLYLQEDFRDSIWNRIAISPVKKRGEYRYSDLGFFYLKRIIEKLIRDPLEIYLNESFYRPMGMNNTIYLPRDKLPLKRIVPTELDDYFRYQLLHGYVHDPAAAMLGGVAGHSGLFASANDLAKLGQMFLNGGTYGGERYITRHTLDKFTRKQFGNNRRGLGFDKPQTDTSMESPASRYATGEAYGHTGFTGTAVWVDPAFDLVFVFLSNRVHPDSQNDKLITMDVRTDIQSVAYEAMADYRVSMQNKGD